MLSNSGRKVIRGCLWVFFPAVIALRIGLLFWPSSDLKVQTGPEEIPQLGGATFTDASSSLRPAPLNRPFANEKADFTADTTEPTVEYFRQLVLSDRWVAAALLAELAPGRVRNEAEVELAVVWANQAPTEAILWARQISEPGERQRVLITVANEIARTEPIVALTVAIGLPADPARDNLVIHAAAQWAASEPTNAAIWAEQIPDAMLRQRVISAVTTEWAERDPHAAAKFAIECIPPGRSQDDAVIGIVQRWSQTAPTHAASWVGGFPEGTLRESAVDVLVDLVLEPFPIGQ